jgi:arylsulfatase A-like enzyme
MPGNRALSLLTAIGVFCVALGVAYSGYWGANPSTHVPVPRHLLGDDPAKPALGALRLSDYRAAVWSVGRNARALSERPSELFDAPMCYPVENSLALHHPIVTPAALVLPFRWIDDDPVWLFNLALWLEVLLAAIAMYWLISDWTGVRAAGIAAGLLFAFQPHRLDAPFHFFTHDNAWFLLALLFARRVFEHRRWRDGLALGVVAAPLVASSSYPFYAAAVAAVPVAVWLVWRSGWRWIPWPALALAALPLGLAASFILTPYLSMHGAELAGRPVQYFASWSWWLPGGRLFPGIAVVMGVVLAGVAGRRRALLEWVGDPRAVLMIAALLLALLAADGNRNAQFGELREHLAAAPAERDPAATASLALPAFYTMARSWLPGLDVIRLPSALAYGSAQLLCVLAGLGMAALIRWVPGPRRRWVATGVVVFAFVEVLWVLPRGPFWERFAAFRMAPDASKVEAFAQLAALGNRGPVLEVPVAWDSLPYRFNTSSAQVLLSAYHRRKTSSCRGSFTPEAVRSHERSAAELLGPRGAGRAREAGFTTLLVHHGSATGRAYLQKLRAADAWRGELQELLTTQTLTAFAIRDRPPTPAGAARNVVLIVVDTLRADHLGTYGYERNVSPQIDRFAKQATVYSRAVSSSPWTLPSHASMFTGLPSYRHGAHTFFVDQPWPKNAHVLDRSHTTLAEALQQRGFETAAFVTNAGFLDRSSNLDQGFGLYHAHRLPAKRHNALVFEWLERRSGAPFFLFVNYMDAHRHYNTRPRPGLLAKPASRDKTLLDQLERAVLPGTEPVPGALAQAVVDQYDTGIAHVDEAVGQLLAKLRELSLFDDSLILITSDHGEYFGEHHLVEHHLDVYQEAVAVPLIVKRAGQTEAARDTTPLASMHLPNLVAQQLPAALASELAAVFPAVAGSAPPLTEAYYAFSDVLNNPAWAPRFTRIRRALYEWPLKLIHSSDGAHELYDLERDPGEQHDLAASRPDDTARMLAAVTARLEAAGIDPAPRAETPPGARLQQLSPEQLEELRALGYVK